jgi:hypothetical protein
MRSDFGRVVIERPRQGSHCPSLKMRKTGRFDLSAPDWREWEYEGPTRIRTKGIGGVKHACDPHLGEKSFTDVLGPVYRFLRSSVGRRWDDVFSEVAGVLSGRGHAIEHILKSHLLIEVADNTWIENGKVFAGESGRSFGYLGKFFVDPRDGTLREDKQLRRYTTAWTSPYDRVYWKEGLWFVRIEGLWFLGCYTPNAARATDLATGPEPESESRGYDAMREFAQRYQDWFWPNVQVDREKRYFVKWKQANRRELAELRQLRNPE